MAIEIKVEYNSRVAKSVQQQLSKDIVDSVEGSPELRAEMRKTLKVANERIRAMNNSGEYSPAVAALGRQSIKGYGKFSIKEFGNSGEDWENAKQEYAKAVSFLQQPTSTISGAKQWRSSVQSQLGLNDYQFDNAVHNLMNGYNEVSEDLVSTIPYMGLLQDLYDEAMNENANVMEEDAILGANEIQKGIEESADKIAGESIELIADELMNAFKM